LKRVGWEDDVCQLAPIEGVLLGGVARHLGHVELLRSILASDQ
jgi:hypothetical protein